MAAARNYYHDLNIAQNATKVLSDADKRANHDHELKYGKPTGFSGFQPSNQNQPFDFDIDFSFEYSLKKEINDLLATSDLPNDIVNELKTLYGSAYTFKEQHPSQDVLDNILNSIHDNMTAYIKSVSYAYKENPARKTIILEGIQLIKNAVEHPNEENIQLCKNYANKLPSTASKTLKIVAALSLMLLSAALVGVGLIALGFGIFGLATGILPLGAIFCGAGTAGIALGSCGILGASKLLSHIINTPDLSLSRAHSKLAKNIDHRVPSPK